MKKIIRLTESDLIRVVKRTITEMSMTPQEIKNSLNEYVDITGYNNDRIKYYFKYLDKLIIDGMIKNETALDKVLKHAKDHVTKEEYEKVMDYFNELTNSSDHENY